MNIQTILLIAAGVYLATRYLPTAVALLRTEFSYHSFDIISVQADYIRASVTLKAENKTKTSFLLQRIDAGMTLNGKLIGLINNAFNMPIGAGSSELIKIIFDIKKSQVGTELWSMIINKQTQFSFEIHGKVLANDNQYPLNIIWTMDDIIEIVNPKSGGGDTTLSQGDTNSKTLEDDKGRGNPTNDYLKLDNTTSQNIVL